MDDVERAALAALDGAELVETVREFVRLPSVTGTPGESEAQHWVAERLRRLGCEVDLWPIELRAVSGHPDFPGWEVPRGDAWGLVGDWGGREGPTLILNGHVDVVPEGDPAQWTHGDPFSGRVDGGVIYGRGTCDMKGGLLCNLFAVKAIADAGIALRGRVALQSVVGEEDGGLGTFATLLRGHRGDAAIITEPTTLDLITANAGALTFRLRVTGLSAHASVRREGVDAVEKFWPIWKALRALEAQRNRDVHPLFSRWELPYALIIGTVQAGSWASSVPGELVAEGRLGVALGEPVAQARAQLEGAVAAVCRQDEWLREHPVEVDWFGGQSASGGPPSDPHIADLLLGAHGDLQRTDPQVFGAPYGSDLRLLSGFGGIPSVHYGPGDVRHAHAPNEHVAVDDLLAATRTLIVTVLRYCGAA
ncbi:MAG: ArgE/DapE family deacylase [Nitriliruptorales bacterium]|nr:ArgE/DapE family deacylase [Nitriliruptorales bacterium]